ncbi:hypothetical protein [Streptomyces sp. SPB162]|uniref:hypothetical protein n=1 Tax=Streptomyces sp. SPB162 TaxID=2940560 RepID=UPI00240580CC|nr:hypothetical protein [Streptomyces sp. SPB162]MDF9817201.1 hypothetical protein [Streptomyces sp. SPB162]
MDIRVPATHRLPPGSGTEESSLFGGQGGSALGWTWGDGEPVTACGEDVVAVGLA